MSASTEESRGGGQSWRRCRQGGAHRQQQATAEGEGEGDKEALATGR
jgi:hypothetical protein